MPVAFVIELVNFRMNMVSHLVMYSTNERTGTMREPNGPFTSLYAL